MNENLEELQAEALPEVCKTIIEINAKTEYFNEILKQSVNEEKSSLTKTKLELITECHKLALAISNLESAQVNIA